MRRLLAFDLDRLTPFRPQDVYFDIILPANGTGERVRAQLVVVPRARAHALLAQVRSQGLEDTALGRWRTPGGDRESVVSGKSVAVRVALGGSVVCKEKKKRDKREAKIKR